jgi:chaperonin cofactor prefoldin
MGIDLKIQNLKNVLFFILVAIFLFVTPAFSNETSDLKTPPETMAEFETLKSEWEKVRDQQIRMIQDKEQDLERLKEELFEKMRDRKSADFSGEDSGVVPTLGEGDRLAAAAADPRVIESFEQKIAELKEANRKLSGEISELKARIRELEIAGGSPSSDPGRDELRKEKEELDIQKVAFQKERQKFFQEMARQKEKLREAESDQAGDGLN